jgi:hypothetical protein
MRNRANVDCLDDPLDMSVVIPIAFAISAKLPELSVDTSVVISPPRPLSEQASLHPSLLQVKGVR